jgi:hypothetical protein
MKTNLAKQVLEKLTENLGHNPTAEETAKELNGAGFMILADSILNEDKKHLHFADDLDSELQIVKIPEINGLVRCDECMDYDHWEYVDHDYSDPEEFQKEVTFKCMARTHLTGYAEPEFCENNITIYLDENNQPVFPKVRK